MSLKHINRGLWTSRELLEYIAGEEHAYHTVIAKRKSGNQLWFWCSCGARCVATLGAHLKPDRRQAYIDALRNVQEVK